VQGNRTAESRELEEEEEEEEKKKKKKKVLGDELNRGIPLFKGTGMWNEMKRKL
jgi:hypothetical protein